MNFVYEHIVEQKDKIDDKDENKNKSLVKVENFMIDFQKVNIQNLIRRFYNDQKEQDLKQELLD